MIIWVGPKFNSSEFIGSRGGKDPDTEKKVVVNGCISWESQVSLRLAYKKCKLLKGHPVIYCPYFLLLNTFSTGMRLSTKVA